LVLKRHRLGGNLGCEPDFIGPAAGLDAPRGINPAPQADRLADHVLRAGDMENRIKEQFSLFADRVSAETMRANQMRLYLSAMAYILVSGLRRLGLAGPNWRRLRCRRSARSC
jgi:hypothetical protein